MTATIDTGASLTLINREMASKLKLTKKMVKGVFIRIISGEKEEVRELAEITVTFENTRIAIDCYIIPGLPVELLLGLNWLYASKAKIDFSGHVETLTTEFTLGQAFAFLLNNMSDTFHPVIDCELSPYSYEIVEVETSRPLTGTYILLPGKTVPIGLKIPPCEVILIEGYGEIIVKNFSCGKVTLRRTNILGTVDDELIATNEYILADPPPWEAPNKKNELKINPTLNENQKDEIVKVIDTYHDLFSPLAEFGQVKDFTFTIDLKENFIPFTASPYEKTALDRKLIADQVDEMLKFKVIQKCDRAEFCSPVFTVPKRDGGRRIVVDFRKLNQETIDLRWPIPNVQAILDALSGNKFFTTLDMRSGYWQVPLAEKDRSKTAFITHLGTFEFNVLPFGLKCAPAFFQHMVDSILDKLVWDICVAYLDDMFILGKSWEEHITNCEKVFDKLAKAKLKINLNKSEFAYNEVDYLGHHVSADGISPASKNIAPITKFPRPTTVREVKSFLGMANFYRTFIPTFAAMSEPLNNLTRKEVPFKWTDECEKAFGKIKLAISSQPVLAFFDETKEIRVYTDACKHGIGGILNQVHNDKERLVACVSRCTSRVERKYSITELEGLAIVWTLTMLRHYLIGREFTIFTDHHALCFILSGQPMQPKSKQLRNNDKMIRWLLRLGDFNFTVVHKSGAKIPHADCISRGPLPIDPSSEPDDLPIFLDGLLKELNVEQVKDETLNFHIRRKPEKFKKVKRNIYKIDPNGSLRLCIPSTLRKKVIRMLHDESGHLGRNKVQENAKKRFYWPKMNDDIQDYINRCHTCQMYAYRRRKQQFPLQPIINKVSDFLDLVGVDAIGPLPTTYRGNKFALVMIDYFTKWSEAVPVKALTAEATVKFFRQVFSHIGAPKKLLSDNGSNFVAEETEKYLDEQGIVHIKATAYHPETNGLCERFNKTLKHILTKMLDGRPKSEWDLLMKDAIWFYNTSVQETTKLSPYYMVFKKEPDLIIDRKLPTYMPTFNPSKVGKDITAAQKNLDNKAARMLAKFENKPLELVVGDRVKWFPPHKYPRTFERKAEGPFIVKEKLCPTTYLIESEVDKSIKRAHVNSLEKLLHELASEQDCHPLDRSSRVSLVRVDDLDDEDELGQVEGEIANFHHYSQSESDDEEEFEETNPNQISINAANVTSTRDKGMSAGIDRNKRKATQGQLRFDEVNLTDLLNASSSSEADKTGMTDEIRLILAEKKRMKVTFDRTFAIDDSHLFDEASTKISPDSSFKTPNASPEDLNQTVLWNVNESNRQMKMKYYQLALGIEGEGKDERSFGTSTPTTRRVTWPSEHISPFFPKSKIPEHADEEEAMQAAGGDEIELPEAGQDKLNYTVEEVLSHRVVDGQHEYLLKWTNYDEPTWNKIANMNCARLVREYEERIRAEEEEESKNRTPLNEESTAVLFRRKKKNRKRKK